jgi:hypothetical protein
MNVPRARHDDLLMTKLEDEVVVYDPERKQAHSLNRTALAVWNHADGHKSLQELQRLVTADTGLPVNQAAILQALRKLERAHLLMEKVGTVRPMTRREMLAKAGQIGAAAAAAPLVVSALIPTAAAAASGCSGLGATCASGPGCVCSETMTNGEGGAPIKCVTPFGAPGIPCNDNSQCPTAAGFWCVENDESKAGTCLQECTTGVICLC